MDSIRIRGIRCFSHIGVTEQERARRQPLQIDLILWLNLRKAALEDDFASTVDYSRIVEEVRRLSGLARFALIEALAEHLCRRLLQKEPIEKVRLRLRKFPADLRDKIDYVAVDLMREK